MPKKKPIRKKRNDRALMLARQRKLSRICKFAGRHSPKRTPDGGQICSVCSKKVL